MTEKSKVQRRLRRFTSMELRTIAYLSTLCLAGLAIYLQVEAAVVWGFLGVAIGMTLRDLNHR